MNLHLHCVALQLHLHTHLGEASVAKDLPGAGLSFAYSTAVRHWWLGWARPCKYGRSILPHIDQGGQGTGGSRKSCEQNPTGARISLYNFTDGQPPRLRFLFLNESDLHHGELPCAAACEATPSGCQCHVSGGINNIHGPDTIGVGVPIHAFWMRRCSSSLCKGLAHGVGYLIAGCQRGWPGSWKRRGTLALVAMPYCQRALACLLAASISRTGGTKSCAQLSLSELKLAKSSTDHLFHAEKRASHLITPRGGPTAEHSILSTVLYCTHARIVTKGREPSTVNHQPVLSDLWQPVACPDALIYMFNAEYCS